MSQEFAKAPDWAIFIPDPWNTDDQLFDASLTSIRDYLRLVSNYRSQSADADFTIEVGFLESIRPNALANKEGDTHIAAMHTSLAMVIDEFALFCLAQAHVFPEIGDVAQETSPCAQNNMPPGLSVLIQTLQTKGAIDADLVAPIMPIDPHRYVAAKYLAQLMMRFVWLHEVGHGVLGHIDYLRAKHPTDAATALGFNELHMNELDHLAPDIDNRVLQCLEFEADSWALSKSIIIQKDRLENIDGIAALPVDLRLRMALFGIYAMSWLMETMASTSSRGRLAITHPAPIRRMHMLQNMAVWELNDLKLDAPTITQSVLRDFEGVLAQVGKQWLQTDKFEPLSYRAVFEQTRDRLEPYRYVDQSSLENDVFK